MRDGRMQQGQKIERGELKNSTVFSIPPPCAWIIRFLRDAADFDNDESCEEYPGKWIKSRATSIIRVEYRRGEARNLYSRSS